MIDSTFLPGLLDGGWRGMRFRPFRAGIEICRLIEGEPGAAILRYEPGACVPRHRHGGLETIFVLQGSQQDERGVYPAGSVVFNHEGSEHSVQSPEGCVVLIHWDRPVHILDEDGR